MKWPMYPLGQLCDVIIGATPARKEPAYWGGDNVWVTVSELNDNTICDSKEHITDLGIQNSASKLIPKGTLLFSFKLSIGKMAFAGVDLYTNEAIAALPIRRGVPLDNRFLYYALRQFDSSLGAHIAVKGKLLNKRKIKRIPIPLPPLSEQRRIVEILDQADALRKKRAEADAKAARILPALFYKMFGDPATNPKGWPKKKLGDLIKVKSGNFLPAKDMDPSGKFPVYGGNGVNGFHSEFMFEEPVIVLGRVGVYCGAVHYTKPRCWVTDNALYVAEYSNELRPRYLAEALRIANLNQYAGRAGQPLISGSRIYPVKILVPSLEQQKLFEQHLEWLDENDERRQEIGNKLDNLFRVLLHRAFTGDLTAQWREAHMKELLEEMEQQAKALETQSGESNPAEIRPKRRVRRRSRRSKETRR